MCLLLLLIWSEDGEYSGQSLMFSVQTHTLPNHSEDNWQCFLAVVLAVCFALSIMILNVRKKNVVFFQGLFNPEVRYSLRVILSVILGFFTGYSGSGWEKNKKIAWNFQKWRILRIAASLLAAFVFWEVWWLLEAQLLGCWSVDRVGPIPWQPYATTLGYCQSYSYFAEQVPRVSIGISVALKKKWRLDGWWDEICRADFFLAWRGEEPQPHSGSGLRHCCLLAWWR